MRGRLRPGEAVFSHEQPTSCWYCMLDCNVIWQCESCCLHASQQAFRIVQTRGVRIGASAAVDADAVTFRCQVEGVQPMVTIEDCVEAEELVKADKGIQALLKERYGITDMSMVAADPWFYGDRFGELQAPSPQPVHPAYIRLHFFPEFCHKHDLALQKVLQFLQPAHGYVEYHLVIRTHFVPRLGEGYRPSMTTLLSPKANSKEPAWPSAP